jgi:hypothetical protein
VIRDACIAIPEVIGEPQTAAALLLLHGDQVELLFLGSASKRQANDPRRLTDALTDGTREPGAEVKRGSVPGIEPVRLHRGLKVDAVDDSPTESGR